MRHWQRKAFGAVIFLTALNWLTPALAEEFSVKARAAAAKLNATLKNRLQAAIKEQGPAGAVRVCATEARILTRQLESETGLKIRRTSLKVRNPEDLPDPLEQALLTRLAKLHEAGNLPREVIVEFRGKQSRTFLFAQPIVVQPLCLTCHGDPATIPPDVREALRKTYPDDRAVGYRAGDLRGIVSITGSE